EAWTRIDEPGIYRGQCTELCGRDHAFMPIVVDARTPEDFAVWLDEKKAAAAAEAELTSKEWTLEELMERGERIYTSTCVACHQANGEGLPPMFPALKGSDMVLNDVRSEERRVGKGGRGRAARKGEVQA